MKIDKTPIKFHRTPQDRFATWSEAKWHEDEWIKQHERQQQYNLRKCPYMHVCAVFIQTVDLIGPGKSIQLKT